MGHFCIIKQTFKKIKAHGMDVRDILKKSYYCTFKKNKWGHFSGSFS